jgi:hypothetical protein
MSRSGFLAPEDSRRGGVGGSTGGGKRWGFIWGIDGRGWNGTEEGS